eukprot:110781_1
MSFYTSTTQPVNERNMINTIPTVPERWIFTMIGLGFIGFLTLSFLLLIVIYKTYQSIIIQRKQIAKLLVLLNLTLCFFNAISCFEWAFLRTDLFFDVNITKCTVIYISNYLFYMLAKYCLHILLLYRLYLTFHGTTLEININFLKIFYSIITIDFIIFVILWIQICFRKVSVGVIVPSEILKICTLYNNSSASEMTTYERTWPLLFGIQDSLVGIGTLSIFIYKLNQLTKHIKDHDCKIEPLLRKLFILCITSILSTFIMFTFAIPFYPNLTFLLPLDALINSLCVFLLLEWANTVYIRLCCLMDICLQSVVKYAKKKRHKTSEKSSIDLKGINVSNVSTGYIRNDSPYTYTLTKQGLTPDTLTNMSSNIKLETATMSSDKTETLREKYIKPTLERMKSYDEVEKELNNVLATVMNEPSKSNQSPDFQCMGKSKSDGQTQSTVLHPLQLSQSRLIKSLPLL